MLNIYVYCMASLVHDMLITAVLNKAYGGAMCQSVTVAISNPEGNYKTLPTIYYHAIRT